MTRNDYVRQLNTIVRKHKMTQDRRRRLPDPKTRPAIPAQVGSAGVGSAETP